MNVTPTRRAGTLKRVGIVARLGVAMMFHSKLRLVGTLLGVVFPVVLANFALGTMFGLLAKSTLLQRNAKADIWIVPAGAETLGQGTLDFQNVLLARTTEGVGEAQPMLFGGAAVTLPNGRREPVTVLGVPSSYELGGPWNVVAGDVAVLRQPDTLLFDSTVRKTFGGLNVGSVREVNDRRTSVGGLTWGLAPFGASFAYADYETAREYLRTPRDRVGFVLVRVESGVDVASVVARIRARVDDAAVYETSEFVMLGYKQVLTKTPIGVTFITISVFGLVVGLVIVGLAMFSSVVDNLREFGTLKAIGLGMTDLTLVLFAQSVLYALVGSGLGLLLVNGVARAMRSPNVGLELPPALSVGTTLVMVVVCVASSLLAIQRLRSLEAGIVFR
jgi:putative ABC transport system permease protein